MRTYALVLVDVVVDTGLVANAKDVRAAAGRRPYSPAAAFAAMSVRWCEPSREIRPTAR